MQQCSCRTAFHDVLQGMKNGSTGTQRSPFRWLRDRGMLACTFVALKVGVIASPTMGAFLPLFAKVQSVTITNKYSREDPLLSPPEEVFQALFSHCPQLTELGVANARASAIDPQIILSAARYMPIASLKLGIDWDVTSMNLAPIDALVDQLIDQWKATLTSLDCRGEYILSDASLMAIATNCTLLKKLSFELRDRYVSADGLVAAVAAMSTSSHFLHLFVLRSPYQVQPYPEHWRLFDLMLNMPRMRSLDLGSLDVMADLQRLPALFSACPHMSWLKFKGWDWNTKSTGCIFARNRMTWTSSLLWNGHSPSSSWSSLPSAKGMAALP